MSHPTKFCPRCRRTRPMNRRLWAFDHRGAPAPACRACGGVPRAVVGAAVPLRIEAILELAASGLVDKQIGRRLGLSHSTVRNHLERHYERTGLPCRTAAVVGWLLSDDCTPDHLARVRQRLGLVDPAAVRVVA